MISVFVLFYTLSFRFHHFLRINPIIINTFAPKLHPLTRMYKVQIICFETPPLSLQVSKNRKFTGILNCKRHESTRDDNVKQLCEVSRILPNGEHIKTFPILNLFVFIRVKTDGVSMKKYLEFSPYNGFELYFPDRATGVFLLIKSHQKVMEAIIWDILYKRR